MDPTDTVVVRTFATEATAQLAARRLEVAGIICVLARDDCGGNFPAMTTAGGLRLLVAPADADAARRLMEDIEHPGSDSEEPTEPIPSISEPCPEPKASPPDRTSSARSKRGFWLGLVVGVAVSGIVFGLYEYRQRHFTGAHSYDLNGDGKPDVWFRYFRGDHERWEQDRNSDGRPDEWVFYAGGWMFRSEGDDNFDGKPDTWYSYRNEVVVESKEDTDFDGKPDVTVRYESGVPQEAVWTPGESGVVRHKQIFRHGVLQEAFFDNDGDGVFDEKVTYDALQMPDRVETLKEVSAPP
jgi:hypothetical protein